MAKVQLSHSAKDKYLTCGELYRLHYIQKIRPTAYSAALVFGNALDVALNELVMPTGKVAEDVFEAEFIESKIASTVVFIPTYTQLVYSNSNFDVEVLVPDDYEKVHQLIDQGEIQVEQLQTTEAQLEFYKAIKKKKQDKQELSEDEKKYYNLFNWLSLYRKGLLMIQAYRTNILPLLTKVVASQERINLYNEDGDIVRGVVDLVAEVEGHGVVILDNKTSAMRYENDSVAESDQLALYVHTLEEKYKTNKAGFIVLQKQIKKNRVKICKTCGHSGDRAKTCDAVVEGKRCHGEWDETITPEVKTQFIIDTISKQRQEEVINNMDLVNEMIKSGEFEKNFSSCDNQYGAPCVYYNLCHNNSMKDLVDLKKDGKNG